MELIVDNTRSIHHQILTDLRQLDGKPCSIFHATRNVPLPEGFNILEDLVSTGLVEKIVHQVKSDSKDIELKYYRLAPKRYWTPTHIKSV